MERCATSVQSPLVNDTTEKVIRTGREQAARRVEHSRQVLNRPEPDDQPDPAPPHEQLGINTDIPTEDEIRKVVLEMKSGKAPGTDMIYSEPLKADPTTAITALMHRHAF